MNEPKSILVTGGSGLIGTALVQSLLRDHYDIGVLTRRPADVRKMFDGQVSAYESLQQISPQQPIHQVINLAGEQIVGKRWSNERKKAIVASRVHFTQNLVDFLKNRPNPPEVLISGSAVGYYGDTGAQEINEASSAGTDFGARLCEEWEESAASFGELGGRVCLIRTGLVLSTDGGMLQQMLLPFKLGLGTRLGNGKQWMSWIHIDDEVGGIRHLLQDNQARGAFNFTAPAPVTNRAFTKALGSALRRPAIFVAPEILIRFGLGEAAELLLGGQKALPARLEAIGYEFKFRQLDQALLSLLN